MPVRLELTLAIRERIYKLRAIGWSYRRIYIRYLQIPLSIIKYTIKKEPERKASVSKLRSGRLSKLDITDKARLFEVITKNPKITYEDLLAEVSYKVKIDLIRRLLNTENHRKQRYIQRLDLTEEKAAKRLRQARSYKHFTLADQARIFQSDEYTIKRGIGIRREQTFIRLKD